MFVVAALATVIGAMIQGSIGFGMNLVTVPALALVLPEALPVAVIILGIPISLSMLRYEHDAVDRAGIAWIIVGRVPGTICGVAVVAIVSTRVLQGVVGVVVLTLVAASMLMPPIQVSTRTQLAAGWASGLTGTAAGIGGPPLALLYQHHAGAIVRSTLAASFLFGTFLSVAGLALAGQVSSGQALLGAGLSPLAIAGSIAGRRFHSWLDRGWLRPLVLAFVSVAAAMAVADALM